MFLPPYIVCFSLCLWDLWMVSNKILHFVWRSTCFTIWILYLNQQKKIIQKYKQLLWEGCFSAPWCKLLLVPCFPLGESCVCFNCLLHTNSGYFSANHQAKYLGDALNTKLVYSIWTFILNPFGYWCCVSWCRLYLLFCNCFPLVAVYHAIFLEELTTLELMEKIANLYSISPQQINRIYRQGPTGIHVLVSNEVRGLQGATSLSEM